MIRQMVLEYICIEMGLFIRGTGWIICKMARVFKLGRMVVNMRESIKMGRRMGKGLMLGLMGVITLGSGLKIRFMVMENIYGEMGERLRGIGNIIKCMVLGFILGKMVESMKDIILMIKSMGMGSMHGQMVDRLKGNGPMESDRERVN